MNEDIPKSSGIGSWLRPMAGRDPRQEHRAATPLELLYDLCFVVAIAQAAHRLHHAILHGEGLESVLSFGMVFFAIWWTWMGFTWFASAFDNDDPLYRLKVLLQMGGLLVIAAGIPRAFAEHDFRFVTFGYVIMRVGLVAQWLRAAHDAPEFRHVAMRYVFGIVICQIGWCLLLLSPGSIWLLLFLLLVICELAVPAWAEKAQKTPWHPEHIAERYGLLTIIVIGESVLAATIAVQKVIDAGGFDIPLLVTVISAPVILFAMWWIYFLFHAPAGEESSRKVFLWAYAHFFIFASAAAVGAGLAVEVDFAAHEAHLSSVTAGLALAVPVAVFLSFQPLHSVECRGHRKSGLLVSAVLCLVTAWLPFTPLFLALILVLLTVFSIRKQSE